jgi:hypothetical protein
MLKRNALQRSAALLERSSSLAATDAAAAIRTHFSLERRKVLSVESFATLSEVDHKDTMAYLNNLQALLGTPDPVERPQRDETIYKRNADVEGPMHGFDYSYLDDKLGADKAASLQLASHSTPYGGGGMFTYEALNLVDGKRTVSDVRDWLVAELGDVPLQYVAEYLQALESIDVLRRQ